MSSPAPSPAKPASDTRPFSPKIDRDYPKPKLELPPGHHTAVASYSGDSHYDASESAPVTFTVS